MDSILNVGRCCTGWDGSSAAILGRTDSSSLIVTAMIGRIVVMSIDSMVSSTRGVDVGAILRVRGEGFVRC